MNPARGECTVRQANRNRASDDTLSRGRVFHCPLGSNFQGIDEFVTATGHVFLAPSYTIAVNWFGRQLEMPIAVSAEVREALLGNQMLQGCRLTIDYEQRTVQIDTSA